jgi:GTP-binding protein HflX
VIEGESEESAIPIIEAWNKLDILDGERREALEAAAQGRDDVVLTSATSGEGLTALEERLARALTAGHRRFRLELPLADGAGAAWLHQHGEVLEHWVEGDRAFYEVRMAPSDLERFRARREKA